MLHCSKENIYTVKEWKNWHQYQTQPVSADDLGKLLPGPQLDVCHDVRFQKTATNYKLPGYIRYSEPGDHMLSSPPGVSH